MEQGRVYNFSAGPSMLPEEVLKQAASEMLNYKGSGQSVMEMSHRSKVYEDIIHEAEQDYRDLLGIPDNYKVLFLQGGGSTQFAMVPMNLANKTGKVDIVMTGMWTKRAKAELDILAKPHVVASSEDKIYSYIPKLSKEMFDPTADYAYICWNNTIYGTHYNSVPDTNGLTLVADMSSSILSEEVDVNKFGLILAGAQKNMGPAGVTVVVIRDDLIGQHRQDTPTMLRYETHAKDGSLYNTPPTYAIYVAGLVFKWVKEKGGVKAMNVLAREKAGMFYDYLDNSKIFRGTVEKDSRSLMNIPFVTGDAELDKRFIAEAEAKGFVNLKGHRTVGGMRASIYNAMPKEGVADLITFMEDFERSC